MRLPPKHKIDVRALKVWKISAMIYSFFLWGIIAAITFFTYNFYWPIWILITSAVLGVILTYSSVFIFPKIRFMRWRYEIFEQEIYIQHGVLILTRTIIPMIRVQHVETEQGPIMKRFAVASVSISTAATTHQIPALSEKDASDLRDRISQLARVDEDDV